VYYCWSFGSLALENGVPLIARNAMLKTYAYAFAMILTAVWMLVTYYYILAGQNMLIVFALVCFPVTLLSIGMSAYQRQNAEPHNKLSAVNFSPILYLSLCIIFFIVLWIGRVLPKTITYKDDKLMLTLNEDIGPIRLTSPIPCNNFIICANRLLPHGLEVGNQGEIKGKLLAPINSSVISFTLHCPFNVIELGTISFKQVATTFLTDTDNNSVNSKGSDSSNIFQFLYFSLVFLSAVIPMTQYLQCLKPAKIGIQYNSV